MSTTTPATNIQALGMGALLDTAIRLYRRNFVKFTGIIAAMLVPLTAIQLVITTVALPRSIDILESNPEGPPAGVMGEYLWSAFGGGGTIVVILLSFVLVQGVATAALVRAVASNYLGDSLTIVDAYKAIRRQWWPLVVTLILAGFINLLLILYAVIVPCIGWLTGLGASYYFVSVLVPLLAPIIVLERTGGRRAIRRAWDLARRRFWWLLGFVLILFVFGQIVVTGPSMLASFTLNLVFGLEGIGGDIVTTSIVNTVIQSIVQLIFRLVYLPLQLTAITLAYFDVRVRTEGFDLTLMAASMRGEGEALEEITAQAPAPERGTLVTANELGNFFVMTIGTGVFFVVVMTALTLMGMASLLALGGFPQ